MGEYRCYRSFTRLLSTLCFFGCTSNCRNAYSAPSTNGESYATRRVSEKYFLDITNNVPTNVEPNYSVNIALFDSNIFKKSLNGRSLRTVLADEPLEPEADFSAFAELEDDDTGSSLHPGKLKKIATAESTKETGSFEGKKGDTAAAKSILASLTGAGRSMPEPLSVRTKTTPQTIDPHALINGATAKANTQPMSAPVPATNEYKQPVSDLPWNKLTPSNGQMQPVSDPIPWNKPTTSKAQQLGTSDSTEVKQEAPAQEESDEFTVEIPDGYSAGDGFTVQVGDLVVTLTVPDGSGPGQLLTFSLPRNQPTIQGNDEKETADSTAAPTSQSIPPVQDEQTTELQEFTVTVPEGLVSGDPFTVNVGETVVTLTVPDGLGAGDSVMFSLEVPVSKPSLTKDDSNAQPETLADNETTTVQNQTNEEEDLAKYLMASITESKLPDEGQGQDLASELMDSLNESKKMLENLKNAEAPSSLIDSNADIKLPETKSTEGTETSLTSEEEMVSADSGLVQEDSTKANGSTPIPEDDGDDLATALMKSLVTSKQSEETSEESVEGAEDDDKENGTEKKGFPTETKESETQAPIYRDEESEAENESIPTGTIESETQNEVETELQDFTVVIPDGVMGGETFTVNVGDMVVTLTCPEDSQAGEDLLFSLEVPKSKTPPEEEQNMDQEQPEDGIEQNGQKIPNQTTENGDAEQEEDETELVQFTAPVPEGVLAGETFTVEVAEMVVTLTVPDGMQAGEDLLFSLELPKQKTSQEPEESTEEVAEEIEPFSIEENSLMDKIKEEQKNTLEENSLMDKIKDQEEEESREEVEPISQADLQGTEQMQTGSNEKETEALPEAEEDFEQIEDEQVQEEEISAEMHIRKEQSKENLSQEVAEPSSPVDLRAQEEEQDATEEAAKDGPNSASTEQAATEAGELDVEAADAAEELETETRDFTVEIPVGLVPGDEFEVDIGDFTVTLTVPDGLQGGTDISFSLDLPKAKPPVEEETFAFDDYASESEDFTVEIPEGAMPGDSFNVDLWDSIVTLTVPDGLGPGDEISFSLPKRKPLPESQEESESEEINEPVPTQTPTSSPTMSPTNVPSPFPTHAPTMFPTPSPTSTPTPSPTPSPTPMPTPSPTTSPTPAPTPSPTTFEDKLLHSIFKNGGGPSASEEKQSSEDIKGVNFKAEDLPELEALDPLEDAPEKDFKPASGVEEPEELEDVFLKMISETTPKAAPPNVKSELYVEPLPTEMEAAGNIENNEQLTELDSSKHGESGEGKASGSPSLEKEQAALEKEAAHQAKLAAEEQAAMEKEATRQAKLAAEEQAALEKEAAHQAKVAAELEEEEAAQEKKRQENELKKEQLALEKEQAALEKEAAHQAKLAAEFEIATTANLMESNSTEQLKDDEDAFVGEGNTASEEPNVFPTPGKEKDIDAPDEKKENTPNSVGKSLEPSGNKANNEDEKTPTRQNSKEDQAKSATSSTPYDGDESASFTNSAEPAKEAVDVNSQKEPASLEQSAEKSRVEADGMGAGISNAPGEDNITTSTEVGQTSPSINDKKTTSNLSGGLASEDSPSSMAGEKGQPESRKDTSNENDSEGGKSQKSTTENTNNKDKNDKASTPKELPEGWEHVTDPDSGASYYWSEQKNEVWQAITDAATGRVYYWNPITNETTWVILERLAKEEQQEDNKAFGESSGSLTPAAENPETASSKHEEAKQEEVSIPVPETSQPTEDTTSASAQKGEEEKEQPEDNTAVGESSGSLTPAAENPEAPSSKHEEAKQEEVSIPIPETSHPAEATTSAPAQEVEKKSEQPVQQEDNEAVGKSSGSLTPATENPEATSSKHEESPEATDSASAQKVEKEREQPVQQEDNEAVGESSGSLTPAAENPEATSSKQEEAKKEEVPIPIPETSQSPEATTSPPAQKAEEQPKKQNDNKVAVKSSESLTPASENQEVTSSKPEEAKKEEVPIPVQSEQEQLQNKPTENSEPEDANSTQKVEKETPNNTKGLTKEETSQLSDTSPETSQPPVATNSAPSQKEEVPANTAGSSTPVDAIQPSNPAPKATQPPVAIAPAQTVKEVPAASKYSPEQQVFKDILENWTVEKLTKFLKTQKLSTSGKKEDQIDRIVLKIPLNTLNDLLNKPMGNRAAATTPAPTFKPQPTPKPTPQATTKPTPHPTPEPEPEPEPAPETAPEPEPEPETKTNPSAIKKLGKWFSSVFGGGAMMQAQLAELAATSSTPSVPDSFEPHHVKSPESSKQEEIASTLSLRQHPSPSSTSGSVLNFTAPLLTVLALVSTGLLVSAVMAFLSKQTLICSIPLSTAASEHALALDHYDDEELFTSTYLSCETYGTV